MNRTFCADGAGGFLLLWNQKRPDYRLLKKQNCPGQCRRERKKLEKRVVQVYRIANSGNDKPVEAFNGGGGYLAMGQTDLGDCGASWSVLAFWQKAENKPGTPICEMELTDG